jgi:hypothetical protein
MLKKLLLLSFILGLSYCTLWVGGYSHLEQIEDDEHVGKTLLIYPSAGQFVPDTSWYFGKRSGDSYFSSSKTTRDSESLPVLYTIVGKYGMFNHGMADYFVDDSHDYLVEPVKGKANKRLFFYPLFSCEEQTDLFDQETNIKIDFVCD